MVNYSPITTTRSRSFNISVSRTSPDYESSVDIDQPVVVDLDANPIWKRRHLQRCWAAKGQCAQDYEDMEAELLEELDQSRRESLCEVGVSLYMIGKTPQKAKPVIIVASQDQQSREEAVKAINRSGLFKSSNFKIGVTRYLPSGPTIPVAGSPSEAGWDTTSDTGGWNPDTWKTKTPGQSHQPGVSPPLPAYYNPKQRLRITGMPVYVKTPDARARMATANIAYNGSSYGYITAAHVFSISKQNTSSVDDGEDLGIPFDSDSEDEEISAEDMSFAANMTLKSIRSGQSQVSYTQNIRPRELMESGSLDDPVPSLVLLGQLAPEKDTEMSLDYAVITISNTKLLEHIEDSKIPREIQRVHVRTAYSKPLPATALTTHGPINGTLINLPTLMRLPGSKSFQPVYTFSYQGAIRHGDCGSLVLDTLSKELCGMVVAASERQPLAYVVSAKELSNHIARTGWQFLHVDDDYMSFGERDDQAAYAPATQKSQAVLPEVDASQVESSLRSMTRADSSSENILQKVSSENIPQKMSLPANIINPTKTQPEWNPFFQRYLYLQFSVQSQQWYWNHHDGQNWVFFDWAPQNIAPPIPQMQLQPHFDVYQTSSNHPHQRIDSARAAEPVSIRQGKQVFGSYDGRNAQADSHYERLDSSFYVRDGAFFIEGRVFSILFSEAAGANAVNALRNINNVTDHNSSISMVKYRELVHTQVRRLIVVKRKKEFCFAIPIFTYQGQGTKKPGVSPNEHAIAYSYGFDPQLLPDEPPLTKHAICIVMNNGEKPLARASRIYFGIHHPIQYNVKVKDLGIVHQDWLPTFIGYWHMENLSDTQRSDDITEKADQDDSF